MKREKIFEELNFVFRDVFDNDQIYLTEETTSNDIKDWDSLEHINLIVAIEQHFGIKFDMREVTTMKNVGAMVNIIYSRLNK